MKIDKKFVYRGIVCAAYGDDVNTDVIIPARCLGTTDIQELAKFAMIDLDPDFNKKITPGGFVVAGENFGCGSSRETAPAVLKSAGVGAIIAESFARIFYRSSINIGLPILACRGITNNAKECNKLMIDLASGCLQNLTTGKKLMGIAIPRFLLKRMEYGDLFRYLEDILTGEA